MPRSFMFIPAQAGSGMTRLKPIRTRLCVRGLIMSGIWKRRAIASMAMPVLAEPLESNAASLAVAPIWISSGKRATI